MVLTRDKALRAKTLSAKAEPAYRVVVLALGDDPESLVAVQTACSLASPGGSLVGVYVISMPSKLPLDAHMFEAESRARDALARARAVAENYGLRFVGRIVRAHGVAEAILAEAERLRADLIVLVARRCPGGGARAPISSQMVRTVLIEARSRVMIVSPPEVEGSASAGH
jgi:nucleotide-binding universal stress UspA family protein